MEKEIKFRAWNGKEMLVKGSPLGWGKNLFIDLNGQLTLISSMDNQYTDLDFPVMQFTGLKDRAGKDIYEGDILTRTINFAGGDRMIYYYLVEHDGRCCFTIKNIYDERRVDGKTARLETDLFKQVFTQYDSLDTVEVLGNRFENPELLK